MSERSTLIDLNGLSERAVDVEHDKVHGKRPNETELSHRSGSEIALLITIGIDAQRQTAIGSSDWVRQRLTLHHRNNLPQAFENSCAVAS